MDRETFEQLVAEGVVAIPEKFLRKMENIRIVVEDEPSPNQKQKLKLRDSMDLLGLYEGVPLAARGSGYNLVLPDKITIFQRPIERQANDETKIKELVKNTVWHEIAHYFGLNENGVREAARRKRKNSK